ncbi:unnamed protein product, partial [Polarella glacialis]
DDINDATDRVIAGLEGRALADDASKRLIAYHEAGHALVCTLLPYHDPVNKVTLVPRGQAKGLTWFTPGEDQSLVSRNMLKARIAGALGGRAAEQIVFGAAQVTTGAGDDLQQVERMARGMVTQFGMSNVGSIAIDDGGFLGPEYSEDLAQKIDGAIRSISDECYLNALTLLTKNRECLDAIADELAEVWATEPAGSNNSNNISSSSSSSSNNNNNSNNNRNNNNNKYNNENNNNKYNNENSHNNKPTTTTTTAAATTTTTTSTVGRLALRH